MRPLEAGALADALLTTHADDLVAPGERMLDHVLAELARGPHDADSRRGMRRGIEIEIVASNSARDLRRREADIAVRNFQPSQPDLVATKIADRKASMYATPGYLRRLGNPQTARQLLEAEPQLLAFDRSDVMIRGLGNLGLHLEPRHFPIITDNHLVQWQLAKRGAGICIVMDEVGDRDPRMRRVLPDFPAVPVPIWLATHRELRTSRRIRVVFDLLAEGLRRSADA